MNVDLDPTELDVLREALDAAIRDLRAQQAIYGHDKHWEIGELKAIRKKLFGI